MTRDSNRRLVLRQKPRRARIDLAGGAHPLNRVAASPERMSHGPRHIAIAAADNQFLALRVDFSEHDEQIRMRIGAPPAVEPVHHTGREVASPQQTLARQIREDEIAKPNAKPFKRTPQHPFELLESLVALGHPSTIFSAGCRSHRPLPRCES